MNILSAEDFERLKATGLLYVVLDECDGSFESYLKIYGEEPTVAEKKYDLGNIKIRVKDAEHCRKIQEHLFKLGCRWESATGMAGVVKHLEDASYLYVYADGLILYSDSYTDEDYFKKHQNTEHTFSDEEIGYKPLLPEVDMSKCPPMPSVKPPLGLRPKYIVDKERMQEILEAMERYVAEEKKIPTDWFNELEDLNESSHC